MVSRNLCRLPRYTETVVSRVLQVLGGYLQYPPTPKPPDQALREPLRRVNPAGYLQYLTEPGLHRGAGAVPARGVDRAKRRRLGFRVPTHPWEPPPLQVRGFPILGDVEAG